MRLTFSGFILLLFLAFPTLVQATTFYMAPNGNDGNPGTATQPIASFGRAWELLGRGDTLLLKDGTYTQSLRPPYGRKGTADAPYTIKAQNDGMAIIDAKNLTFENRQKAINLDANDYYIIEGLKIINGHNTDFIVYLSNSDHNILRRISAYNADPDINSIIYGIVTNSEYNLIEDCIAAGSGRKMMMVREADHNTIRRCFTAWERWDGLEWHDAWPWGEGIDLYNSSYNTVENSITYGLTPRYAFTIRDNSTQNTVDKVVDNIGSRHFGNMAVYTSINPGSKEPVFWDIAHPPGGSTQNTVDINANEGYKVGLKFFSDGTYPIENAVIKDFFAFGNGSVGISMSKSNSIKNTSFSNLTLHYNSLKMSKYDSSPDFPDGTDLTESDYQLMTSNTNNLSNSRIDKIQNNGSLTGTGARLSNRYLDGTLTTQPLWPWPMECRGQTELGYSITNAIAPLTGNTNYSLPNCATNPFPTPLPTQVQPPTPAPTTLPTPQSSPTLAILKGDFDQDGDVDIKDFLTLLPFYDTTGHCQYNLTGSSTICTISIFDLNYLLSRLI